MSDARVDDARGTIMHYARLFGAQSDSDGDVEFADAIDLLVQARNAEHELKFHAVDLHWRAVNAGQPSPLTALLAQGLPAQQGEHEVQPAQMAEWLTVAASASEGVGKEGIGLSLSGARRTAALLRAQARRISDLERENSNLRSELGAHGLGPHSSGIAHDD